VAVFFMVQYPHLLLSNYAKEIINEGGKKEKICMKETRGENEGRSRKDTKKIKGRTKSRVRKKVEKRKARKT
jgi:hypothetical protein